MMRSRTAWILWALLMALFSVVFLCPLWMVVSGGFRVEGAWTASYLAGVLRNPIYAEGLVIGSDIAAADVSRPGHAKGKGERCRPAHRALDNDLEAWGEGVCTRRCLVRPAIASRGPDDHPTASHRCGPGGDLDHR